MQKINFQNLPSTSTPVNATNLNAMQTNVENVFNGTEPMGNIKVDTVTTKNLFNINGNVNVRGNTGATEPGLNTVSGNVLTNNVDGNLEHAVGQKFTNLNGKTITFSAKVVSFGESQRAGIFIYENNVLTGISAITTQIDTYVSCTYTCNSDNIICAFTSLDGTGAQFTDIQVEIGDTKTDWAEYQNIDIPTNSLFANIVSAPLPGNNDLNNALVIGQYGYNPDTLNSPYRQIGTDQYGLVLTMSNESNINVYRWVFQIALSTSGNMFIRSNINNGGWSTWAKVQLQ